MSTLTKIKGKVVNPDLPVLTKYGLLSQIVGKYANKLDAVDIVLAQTELDALGAFITALKDGGVLEHITALYPFIGNPNIPLIGNKNLEFSDVTPSNTNLDFNGGKLRGYKILTAMPNVRLSDLIPNSADYGSMFGGSSISIPDSNNTQIEHILRFAHEDNSQLQYRFVFDPDRNGTVFAFYSFDAEVTSRASIKFLPAISSANTQHNFFFAHGVANTMLAQNNYNRTLIEDNTVLSNIYGNDASFSFSERDCDGTSTISQTSNNHNSVYTTLAGFDKVLSAPESLVFVNALKVFCTAVGKTVTV